MLSKNVGKYGRDWDNRLPYLFFAYRVAVQESTKASTFYLLYGRELQVPTSDALAQTRVIYQVDFATISLIWLLIFVMPGHWLITTLRRAVRQEEFCSCLKVGDQVMVFFLSQVKGKAWKLARSYFGPCKVLSLTLTNAEVQLAHDSRNESIFVALECIRRC